VLRTAYGRQRVLLTDEQRRGLAVKGHARGRRRLADVAGIVTPDDSTPVPLVGRPEVRRLERTDRRLRRNSGTSESGTLSNLAH